MEERKQLRNKPFHAGRNRSEMRAGDCRAPGGWEGEISARFGGGGATSASRSMELGDEKLLLSPSLWMVSSRAFLPQPHRLPLLRDMSWAVLSSHLLHKRRLGCKRDNLTPRSDAPRCPWACSCLPPPTRAGLHLSLQITP